MINHVQENAENCCQKKEKRKESTKHRIRINKLMDVWAYYKITIHQICCLLLGINR